MARGASGNERSSRGPAFRGNGADGPGTPTPCVRCNACPLPSTRPPTIPTPRQRIRARTSWSRDRSLNGKTTSGRQFVLYWSVEPIAWTRTGVAAAIRTPTDQASSSCILGSIPRTPNASAAFTRSSQGARDTARHADARACLHFCSAAGGTTIGARGPLSRRARTSSQGPLPKAECEERAYD